MRKERAQGYAAHLEQIIWRTHLNLRESMKVFQELCMRVTPERIVPLGLITDIRQTYKEIQDQITKVRGIGQLLKSKRRQQYYHQDPLYSVEIMEFTFLANSLYQKFESTLQLIEAKRRLRNTGDRFGVCSQRIPLGWFHSKINQIVLLRNLRGLHELEYRPRCELECQQRREVIWNEMRSVSLFVLSGEVRLIDTLQSRMQLREYDIKERYTRDELRGALTHLREIPPSEVVRVIRRFTDSGNFLKLKCVLMSIQSQIDLERAIAKFPDKIFQLLMEGEVRILPF